MLGLVKSVLSVILSSLCFFFSPVFGNFAGDYSPKKDGCLLNFAVISDIHMTDETARRDMLALGLIDMQQAEAPLDALVLAGDMTDHANRSQYEMLESAFANYTPAENIIMAVGNHDTWCGDVEEEFEFSESKNLFIEYNKKIADRDVDNVYYSTTVNGYTFIMLSSEYNHTDAYISDSQLEWLDGELKKASKSGNPIFVVSHWPINGSHGLPLTWLDNPLTEDTKELEPDDGGFGAQSDQVEAILQKYENIFLISGHLHNGLAENSRFGYSSVEKRGNITSINLPSYMYMGIKGAPSNGLGFQFEVYENEVLIRARCFTAGVWYTKSEFSFEFEPSPAITLGSLTPASREGCSAGEFKAGDEISFYAYTDNAASPIISGALGTFDGSAWDFEQRIPWTDKTSAHSFVAVYPARSIESLTSDTYKLDQNDELSVATSLSQTVYTPENPAIDLEFEHLTAKLVLNLSFRSQWNSIPAVDSVKLLGAATEAEVNYIEKTMSPTAFGDVELVALQDLMPENAVRYEAILIPQQGCKKLEVKIGENTYELDYPNGIELSAGKATVINAIVGQDEITLANVSIRDWESQGDEINGEAQSGIVNESSASTALQSEYTVVEQTETANNSVNFVSGDQISVYAWTGAADEVPAERVVDGAINTFDGTSWSADPQMLWTNPVIEHFFLGVYPAHKITDFKADPYVLDTSDQAKSDLLIAVNNGGLKTPDNPVQLNFDHAMAKIKVNLHFRNQWGDTVQVESVTLEGYTSAEVDYMAKAVRGKETGDISLPESEFVPVFFDLSYESVVIPSTETKTIRIRIDNVDYIYNHDTYIPLEKGKVTTIDLNVGRDELTLANVKINDWVSQGDSIENEAKSDIYAQAANVTLQSTATTASFENGSQIKVYGWTGDKTSVPSNSPINSVNTLSVENGVETWKAAPQMLWQSQTAAHYFVGIYPARNVTNFSSDSYVLDETRQEQSDILVAVSDDQGIVANNRGVDLRFDHLMAKLKINLNFSSEFGQTPVPSEVKVYCGKQATINYLIQTVSADAYFYNAAEFIALPREAYPTTGFDDSYSSVIVPQSGVNTIDVVIDGTVYRCELLEDIPLESGKITTVNLNVSKSSAE